MTDEQNPPYNKPIDHELLALRVENARLEASVEEAYTRGYNCGWGDGRTSSGKAPDSVLDELTHKVERLQAQVRELETLVKTAYWLMAEEEE